MGSNKKSLRPTRRRSMKGKYSFQRDDDEGGCFCMARKSRWRRRGYWGRELRVGRGGGSSAIVWERAASATATVVEENSEDVRGPIVRRRRLCSVYTLFAANHLRRKHDPATPYFLPYYIPPYPLRTSSPTAIDFEGNWYRALRTAGPESSFLYRSSLPFNSSNHPLQLQTVPSSPTFTPQHWSDSGGGGDGSGAYYTETTTSDDAASSRRMRVWPSVYELISYFFSKLI